jgi:hypothetical protein
MPTIATPNVLIDPGYLFWAPLATALPTNTVAGSVFTDSWAAAWVPLGATEEGSTFSYSSTVEPVTVAELFDPVKYATTSREGSMAFNLADWTLNNLKRALNGGTVAVVSGTGATALNSYEPPNPGAEVRAMIGWESQDNTVRIILRQCLNGGEIASAFQKAPAKAVIACQFQMEKPLSAQPFIIYTAGVDRVGTA